MNEKRTIPVMLDRSLGPGSTASEGGYGDFIAERSGGCPIGAAKSRRGGFVLSRQTTIQLNAHFLQVNVDKPSRREHRRKIFLLWSGSKLAGSSGSACMPGGSHRYGRYRRPLRHGPAPAGTPPHPPRTNPSVTDQVAVVHLFPAQDLIGSVLPGDDD
jgi:hypothetical protein